MGVYQYETRVAHVVAFKDAVGGIILFDTTSTNQQTIHDPHTVRRYP